MKKLDKKYFITKILISTKLPNPIPETRVSKLVFITIPWLKFWAQSSLHAQVEFVHIPPETAVHLNDKQWTTFRCTVQCT